MVSVIIPVYNEENTILDCLASLDNQSLNDVEIIIVDDGSTDNSKIYIQRERPKLKIKNLTILTQKHLGPATARNFGAKHAKGEILVFVDADMTFDKDLLKFLTLPITTGRSKGTFTKEEYVKNWENIWSRCWNYNQGISDNRRIPLDYPPKSPVFRAILRKEFEKVGGFDDIGFTDDWTLSRKLKYKADAATQAICYHKNPESLKEVYIQSRWIGKNEFISGTVIRRLINSVRYFPLTQTIRGIFISIKYKELFFLIFVWFYYSGVWISVINSFLGEKKFK